MYRLLLIVIVLLTSSTSLRVVAQEYSHGNPTAEEQLLLEMINRARATPSAEGVRLMDTDDAEVQQAYTAWSIDKAKTKTAFNGYPSRPPLAFHPALIKAARLHSADMVANNFQGHTGSNGSQLNERLTAQGYVSQGQYGENVAAYSNSVWYTHCGLNVDWGTQYQIDLGQRSNIMNFSGAVYTEIGIGIQHTNGGLNQGTVGPLVTTEDFGMRSVRYITGVVYDDKNHNSFYDIGEGLEGVKVQPSRGGAWAVSSSSGGYAIPFSGNGSVTVTASGGPLSDPIVVNTSFEGENLKVDFAPASIAPGVITLTTPANNAKNINPKGVVLTWATGAFAESYQVQAATSNTFAAASIIFEGTQTTTTVTLPELPCGEQVHWRVRGINAVGNGTWSVPFIFSTSGTAAGTTSLTGPKGSASFDNKGTVDCSWKAATAASKYHVRFSTNGSFTQVFAEDSAIIGTTFSLPTSSIPDGVSQLYWSARAGNDCGWGPWSGFALVTFTITGINDNPLLNQSLAVVPNPANSSAFLRLSQPLSENAVVEIVDVQGAVVYSASVQGGTSLLVLPNASMLANGVYLVTVRQHSGSLQHTTFVVSH